jgi:hypothetical protein
VNRKTAGKLQTMTDLGPSLTSTSSLKERGKPIMKNYLPVLTALATSLMSSTFIPSLKAGELDKKTIITISQPVAVEGTTLPAGQYVLKLQEDQSSRNIVRIFDGDGRRLIATVLAIHAYRLEPTGETEFKFYDSPAGQPGLVPIFDTSS